MANAKDIIFFNKWHLKFGCKNVYLSGPITMDQDKAKREFCIVAYHMLETFKAEHVFDPANDKMFAYPQGDIYQSFTHPDYMALCITELCSYKLRLNHISHLTAITREPKYDLVVMLPGFLDSRGAAVEEVVANACGIDIVYWEDVLDGASPEMRAYLERRA